MGQNKDALVSLEEFTQWQSTQVFAQVLQPLIRKYLASEPESEKLILEVALEDYPHDLNFLNQQAWMLATSTKDHLRNGDQAVRAALEACELTDYKVPNIIDTLASAYAEQGDFERAVQYAEQACAMIGNLDRESGAMRSRLELFKQRKAYREESLRRRHSPPHYRMVNCNRWFLRLSLMPLDGFVVVNHAGPPMANDCSIH